MLTITSIKNLEVFVNTQLKDVFLIPERENQEKSPWIRIGVAFVNKDDSLNVVLDAIPYSGRLHIRNRQLKKPNYKGKE